MNPIIPVDSSKGEISIKIEMDHTEVWKYEYSIGEDKIAENNVVDNKELTHSIGKPDQLKPADLHFWKFFPTNTSSSVINIRATIHWIQDGKEIQTWTGSAKNIQPNQPGTITGSGYIKK